MQLSSSLKNRGGETHAHAALSHDFLALPTYPRTAGAVLAADHWKGRPRPPLSPIADGPSKRRTLPAAHSIVAPCIPYATYTAADQSYAYCVRLHGRVVRASV